MPSDSSDEFRWSPIEVRAGFGLDPEVLKTGVLTTNQASQMDSICGLKTSVYGLVSLVWTHIYGLYAGAAACLLNS